MSAVPPGCPGADLAEALSRLRARRRPALLDRCSGGGGAGGGRSRFSLLGFDPLRTGAEPRSIPGLRGYVAGLAREPGDDVPCPCFQGGFLGALAYDLGVVGETLDLPPEPWGQPLVVGGLYVDFLVRDHAAGATWLVLGEDPGDGRPPVAERRAELLSLLQGPAPETAEPLPLGPLVRHVSGAEHCARVERARAWIAAGDMYQANLAHRFTRRVSGDPVDLYLRLRRLNPGPYMGFLRWEGPAVPGGEGALLSTSPELLLELDGNVARTRPIKGTAPRGETPEEDESNARALLASEKDRAELAMIVDLARNDLGRVAATGSVRVEELARLESYATVHHLVADVVARPRPDVDAVDALAALFPGGSVTGAPKLRAMERIAELEGEGRGFFTGSLGMLDTRGRAVFNILIRTMLWRPGEVSFRVGGGITWSSDPAAEDRETLAKGAALARALEAEAAACP